MRKLPPRRCFAVLLWLLSGCDQPPEAGDDGGAPPSEDVDARVARDAGDDPRPEGDAGPGTPDAGPAESDAGPSDPPGPPAGALWFDDFESGDFDAFPWASPNRTSIVRDDGCVVHSGEPIMNCGHEERRWESRPGSAGRHAMRFRFPAGEDMAEQRFALPETLPELWICYWIRVPLNFSHPAVDRDNQKLFALWQDDYEFDGVGTTATFQFRRRGDGGSGVSNYQIRPGSGGGRHTGESGDASLWTEGDRGRWMHMCIYARNGAEGRIEQWRRWEGEADYEQLYEASHDLGELPWRAGYIMGWANGPYPENTEFLIDDFMVSTTRPW